MWRSQQNNSSSDANAPYKYTNKCQQPLRLQVRSEANLRPVIQGHAGPHKSQSGISCNKNSSWAQGGKDNCKNWPPTSVIIQSGIAKLTIAKISAAMNSVPDIRVSLSMTAVKFTRKTKKTFMGMLLVKTLVTVDTDRSHAKHQLDNKNH